jgi:catechol 2,3-dioxygenase-like lactoylglutathione lyase family enzyme
MDRGIHHVALAVSDIPAAVSFYAETLGFEPLGPDDPETTIETAEYFWFSVDSDQWLNLAAKPEATPDDEGLYDDPHIAFGASEAAIDDLTEQITNHDIDVRRTETSVYFRDPDGNFLEFTHWSGPAGE